MLSFCLPLKVLHLKSSFYYIQSSWQLIYMFLCLTSVISTIYKYTLSLLVPKQNGSWPCAKARGSHWYSYQIRQGIWALSVCESLISQSKLVFFLLLSADQHWLLAKHDNTFKRPSSRNSRKEHSALKCSSRAKTVGGVVHIPPRSRCISWK